MFSIGLNLVSAVALAVAGALGSGRNFTELTTALGTYWEYENTLVFGAGDTFEFEFLAPTDIVATTMYLTDGDADRGFVILGNTGSFIVNTVNIGVLEVDGVSVGLSSTYPVDGKLHTIKITWDNVAEIKYLGMRDISSSFYTGILADPMATISGQTQTWTLGNGVGVDTEQSTPAGNAITRVNVPDESVNEFAWVDDAWIGAELWSFGDYTYTGTEGDAALLLGLSNHPSVILGSLYTSTWNFSVVGTARSRLRVAGAATYQTTSGTYAFEQVAANTQMYLQNDTDSNLATGTKITSVSVKRKIEVVL